MKVLNRLSDPALGKKMVGKVRELAARVAEGLGRPVILMEVCGTHTTAISRMGLRGLLDGLVELRSGPGCPVCVTDTPDIGNMMALARVPGVTVATFGDMIRVPGLNFSSLEKERARGADVRIVYSPADAVVLARDNPGQEIVFLGVGFETTAPLAALSIKEAARLKLENFSVYSAHKMVPPVMMALLEAGDLLIDGFVLPGHVSAVTGSRAFSFLGEKFGIPAVVAGFTPVDILDAIYILLGKMQRGETKTTNAYRWVVKDEGNPEARQVMQECFCPGDTSWRGFGLIPESGLFLREEFGVFDAARKFRVQTTEMSSPAGCRCGELLRGMITPVDCPLFGKKCTPAKPVGPCMVSSEGACAAYYRFGGGGPCFEGKQ